MTSISEIRTSGTDFVLQKKEIPEPINAPPVIKNRFDRFSEDIYNRSLSSHLFRFISSLVGEVGAGSLQKGLLYPKLQQDLGSTHFDDLEKFYGHPLGLSRLKNEQYIYNVNGALTQAQWQEVRAKDAMYRNRCLNWMRAIIKGPTVEGLALAAEAATGISATVHERYKYLDNIASDDPYLGVTTTLSAGINNSTTTIPVSSSTGFPGAGSYNVVIGTEMMTVTAGQGTTSWTATRHVNGTSAATHSSGDTVILAASYSDYGITSSRSEFVIVPHTSVLTEEEKRNIVRLIDRLRPIDTFPTITDGFDLYQNVNILTAAATSEGFTVTKTVTGTDTIDWPAIDYLAGYWIEANVANIAPYYAFTETQESSLQIDVITITGSTEHIGLFNSTQRSLFSHLSQENDPLYIHTAIEALSNNTSQISFTTPWYRRDDSLAVSE